MAGNFDCDVVIVGAGVAGLTAARGLAEAGLRVALLEAAARVGGRVHTIRMPGSDLPIETGAEFVHGRPPELLRLIEEAGLTLFEREGRFFSFENGRLGAPEWDDSAFDVLDKLPEEGDRPFSEFLAGQNLPVKIAKRVTGYVEGFNAADANVIGTAALRKQQLAEEAIEGERVFRIREGYDRVPLFLLGRFLAAGGRAHLKTAATAIEWKRGEALVRTANAAVGKLRARRVVVALPLGVLKAGSVEISPIPTAVSEAIAKLAMGSATRITLEFRERFWETSAAGLSFLFSANEEVPVWWSASPDGSPTLTGWIGGPRAADGPVGEALRDAAVATLGRIFGRDHLDSLLVGWHSHDWGRDPLSLGVYSYAPAGAVGASDVLAQPVEDTLYFAGEHTDTTGHWGTVHAAIRSGMRVVRGSANRCSTIYTGI
ncbi:MAG: NAD(P)/FAD-dependent oxidoreductase [Acidobacteriaceae bacterium]